MRLRIALCVLALATPAFATARFELSSEVRPPMRAPPKRDVAACKTLEGIRYVRERVLGSPISNRQAITYANKAFPKAGCVYFAEADYVEVETVTEHVFYPLSNEITLEVYYTRVLIQDHNGESFYIVGSRPGFPVFLWDGAQDEPQ